MNIHHEFYAMKIQQISNEFISEFHIQTFEEQLSLMNGLRQTLDHLRDYEQNLNQQNLDYENKLKTIAEEIAIVREYSMVDSLVREQVDDLVKREKQLVRQQERMIRMKTNINETFQHLQELLIQNSDQEKCQELFKHLKQRGL